MPNCLRFKQKSNFIQNDNFSQKGFTFIELLIVVAIIGILGGMFLLTYPNATRKARDNQRRNDIKQYQTALEAYANRHNGLYISTSGLMTSHCTSLSLGTCPDDPSGVSYQYVAGASGLSYYVWAVLEQPDSDGNTEYFVTCSNGVTGTVITSPTGATCPL